jgi:hypothetical protein
MVATWNDHNAESSCVSFLALGERLASVEIPFTCAPQVGTEAASRTVAVLIQGPEDAIRLAVSGQKSYDRPPYQLDSAEATNMVITLCKQIGHSLDPKLCKDVLYKDKWHACHAEKQLAAWWHANGGGRGAVIHVSKRPCPDCIAFFRLLWKSTGVKIRLVFDGKAIPY